MTRTMTRGKQQILFNYLPNRTFDFEQVAAIARVIGIRGDPCTDLNAQVLLRKIAEEASAWQEDFRPALRDNVFIQTDRFIILDPRSVESELFPKVLWCQNRKCSQVFDFGSQELLPKQCPSCKNGRLVQLRFVRIHRCGTLKPLLPPTCKQCHTNSRMALDTRGSERISNFRWICRSCNTVTTLFGGFCTECKWPDKNFQRMDIEVHRAGRTYYAHTTVLLNIPDRRLDILFNLQEWPAVVSAKFLGMPETANRALIDYGQSITYPQGSQNIGLSRTDLDDLLSRQEKGELSPEQIVLEMQVIRERRQKEQQNSSPSGIIQNLSHQTGVPWSVWQRAGQEILEAIMPLETGHPTDLDLRDPIEPSARIARQMGLSRITLVSDYPIITATYGFSRAEYHPNLCRLNPFPAHPDYNGKYPIFVDQVQADAILFSLDPDRVISWLERNGCHPTIPDGSNKKLSRISYFVQLLGNSSWKETLPADYRETRMVFCLLHTLSHLSVRQAALLCGLDRTSLSEYLLPRTLTFALYCNHRYGATIGALTSLFEQSLSEWLLSIKDSRRCVYDPMCRDHASNCHACTHLAETSCRFYNLNLSRAFLFGGRDSELGEIPIGYFDPIV